MDVGGATRCAPDQVITARNAGRALTALTAGASRGGRPPRRRPTFRCPTARFRHHRVHHGTVLAPTATAAGSPPRSLCTSASTRCAAIDLRGPRPRRVERASQAPSRSADRAHRSRAEELLAMAGRSPRVQAVASSAIRISRCHTRIRRVISTRPLVEIVPVSRQRWRAVQMCHGTNSCATAGFLKIDLLGLHSLRCRDRRPHRGPLRRGERSPSRASISMTDVYRRDPTPTPSAASISKPWQFRRPCAQAGEHRTSRCRSALCVPPDSGYTKKQAVHPTSSGDNDAR